MPYEKVTEADVDSGIAAEAVAAHVFVKLTADSDKNVDKYENAEAGEECWGISLDAADSGKAFRIAKGGECELLVGTATSIVEGSKLKADSAGKAVLATAGDEYGAYALQAPSQANERIRVRVVPFGKVPA